MKPAVTSGVRSIVLTSAALPWLLCASATVAQAVVLAEKSPEQQQRRDIGKQVAKHVKCIAKAAIKCEQTGTHSGTECDLVTGTTTPPADPAGTFAESLAKCESKLVFSKKSATGGPVGDYTALGCPGDADVGTAGDQPYTDLTAYQEGVLLATRVNLALFSPLIEGACGGANSTDPAILECALILANALNAFGQGVFKCKDKCENDYKDKNGNGGPADDASCNFPDPDANIEYVLCYGATLSKVAKKALQLGIGIPVDVVNAAITDATNDLYNEDDCP